MRKIPQILIIILITAMYTGCFSKSSVTMQPVEILIPDSMYDEGYIFAVTKDGTMNVKSGNLFTMDDIYANSYESKNKKLSFSRKKELNNLIAEVKKNKEPISAEPCINDAITILVRIDGVDYWSVLGNPSDYRGLSNEYVDENVVHLATTVIELSPFKMPGLKQHIY